VLRSLRTMKPSFNAPLSDISFVEAGFLLQFQCWQFNVRAVIFEIALMRKKRRTNG
jgi:hypothetical protein